MVEYPLCFLSRDESAVLLVLDLFEKIRRLAISRSLKNYLEINEKIAYAYKRRDTSRDEFGQARYPPPFPGVNEGATQNGDDYEAISEQTRKCRFLYREC